MDAEIWIFIAALAISVISSVSKNKRNVAKKKEAAPTVSENDPAADDPWFELREFVREAEHKGTSSPLDMTYDTAVETNYGRVKPIEPAPSNDLFSYEDAAVLEMEQRNLNQDNFKAPEPIQYLPIQIEVEPLSTPSAVNSTEFDNSPSIDTIISGGFNLRDAVIYSEILKPKFDI